MKLKAFTQEQIARVQKEFSAKEAVGELKSSAAKGVRNVLVTTNGLEIPIAKEIEDKAVQIIGTVVAGHKDQSSKAVGYLRAGEQFVPMLSPGKRETATLKTCGYIECYQDDKLIGYIRVMRTNLIPILVPIAIALVAIVAAYFIITLTAPTVAPEPTKPVATDEIIEGEIPVGDPAAILEALQKKVDASRFEVKINSSISLNEESGKYNVMISNTARNIYSCYVEITRKDDGELLYRSQTLDPGQYIPTATLTLPSGAEDGDVIKANATFFVINKENGAYMGRVVVAVDVYVA